MVVTANSSRSQPSAAEQRARRAYRNATSSAVGLEMGVSVIIGMLFGWWLDGKTGTFPLLTIVFLGFGFAAGIRAIWRASGTMMTGDGSGDAGAAKADGDNANGEQADGDQTDSEKNPGGGASKGGFL